MASRAAPVQKSKGRGTGKWVTSTAYRTVIERLREARTAAGVTQRDLAARLKKEPSWVAKIELGERRLDLLEYIAIARALGLKEDELLRKIAHGLPKLPEI
jgi:transcriptional regulator with XRE-family HTH domain